MDYLHLDHETFSLSNLKTVGLSRYARDPSTENLMTAYAFNRGKVEQWVPAEGEPIPPDLEEAITDPEVVKVAWNAPFEMAIGQHVLGWTIVPSQWRCAMAQALHCAMPGSLEKTGEVMALPVDKQKDRRGKALMRKFSFPRKPTKHDARTRVLWHEAIEDWAAYLSYNRDDVEAERAISRLLRPFDMGPDEWDLFVLDYTINNAGLPINRAMVDNAIRVYDAAMKESIQSMKDWTGLSNPNSGAQLLPWLQSQGYFFQDLKKGHVQTALDYFEDRPDHWTEDQWENYRGNQALYEVLTLRAETARTSVKKYHALARATDEDGMLRNVLQMNAAGRTGRWGGRLYQPQNLPRPNKQFEDFQPLLARAIEVLDHHELDAVFGNVFDVLASGLRPAAQAPDGMIFLDADLNAIENRVLGWMAECDKILEVFRLKRDPYIAFACYLYDQDYDTLWHEYKVERNGKKRTIAKPGTLGSGYGMGPGTVIHNNTTGELEATGLTGYAWNMGIKTFTPEDAKHSIDTFRREFKEVVDHWYAMERAMKRAIRDPDGKAVECGVVSFQMAAPFLRMTLPSGRKLHYLRPRIEPTLTPWGATKMQVTYEGMNEKKQWGRIKTTGGKIVENADQAISRDLLAHGMKLAHREGIDIRLHIHDQIVGLCREEEAEEKQRLLIECMETVPSWATGLPLGSNGSPTKVFVKD